MLCYRTWFPVYAAACLAWTVLAVPPPPTLYRGDERNPEEIQKAGGFKTRVDGKPWLEPMDDVVKHSQGGYDRKSNIISTSTSEREAKKYAGRNAGGLFAIDTVGNPNYDDVGEKHHERNDPYGHAREREWGHHGNLPWTDVKKPRAKVDGKWQPFVDNPSYKPRVPPEGQGESSAGKPPTKETSGASKAGPSSVQSETKIPKPPPVQTGLPTKPSAPPLAGQKPSRVPGPTKGGGSKRPAKL
ncbi:hypothetical protein BDZ85DRAFT_304091 [Elsinoe ampelina]|uniref:Uncharacterized protein n=1 Tax=Elsinoe ampelina TaxID=302913 RepID=A0A6A6G3E0_9PEZI|nr:hypothetical protein BDZ85DRAFT_304091 [Elsinoe ampelina]